MAVDLAFSQQAFQRAQELTGLDNPGSVSQLKAWLADMDMPMESLSKRIVQEKATEAEGIVKELLELRLELSKTSIKKYEAMARTVCKDGRVHGMLQFYGASRTGRWCLTGDHEVLTNEGWKRLDEWTAGILLAGMPHQKQYRSRKRSACALTMKGRCTRIKRSGWTNAAHRITKCAFGAQR